MREGEREKDRDRDRIKSRKINFVFLTVYLKVNCEMHLKQYQMT